MAKTSKTAPKKSSKKATPKMAPKKTAPKKPLLSIDAECSWELNCKDIPIDHQFSNKVDDIQSLLNAYIEIIPKKRPKLAQLTIDINVFKKDGNLIVNFIFLDTEYFSINIGKYTTGDIYINRKFKEFSHGGGKYIPPPDWYVSFLSACNCIYNDIITLFN
jgi:hypothetical protein